MKESEENMQKQTMSVTRALAEIKKFDSQINQAIYNGKYVSRVIAKGEKPVDTNESSVELKQKIQGSFDKVNALIRNRQNLKSAIILSNATKLVTIVGRQMTVAEAIELKSTVGYHETFQQQLRQQFTHNKNLVDRDNSVLESQVEAAIQSVLGSSKGSETEETIKAIGKVKREEKEQKLFDPADIEKKIDELGEFIETLKTEIDFVLSESNSSTQIEVEFA